MKKIMEFSNESKNEKIFCVNNNNNQNKNIINAKENTKSNNKSDLKKNLSKSASKKNPISIRKIFRRC